MVARGGSAPLVSGPPNPLLFFLLYPGGVRECAAGRTASQLAYPAGVGKTETQLVWAPAHQGCRATPGNLHASLRDAPPFVGVAVYSAPHTPADGGSYIYSH